MEGAVLGAAQTFRFGQQGGELALLASPHGNLGPEQPGRRVGGVLLQHHQRKVVRRRQVCGSQALLGKGKEFGWRHDKRG